MYIITIDFVIKWFHKKRKMEESKEKEEKKKQKWKEKPFLFSFKRLK